MDVARVTISVIERPDTESVAGAGSSVLSMPKAALL
jgi:hypothetical protein